MAGDNTRGRILEAAGEVFADKGYETATIREICETAGVNLAAVNYYFGGKESLYIQTLERAHLREIRDEDLPDWPPGTLPAVKLRFVIYQLLAQMLSMQDDPWETRLLVREIMNPTASGKRVLREHFRRGFGQLQGILDEILPPGAPDHRRHQIGLSIIGECVLYRSLVKVIPLVIEEDELQQHYGLDELAEHIAQVSLAILGLSPPLVEPAGEEVDCEDNPAASAAARDG